MKLKSLEITCSLRRRWRARAIVADDIPFREIEYCPRRVDNPAHRMSVKTDPRKMTNRTPTSEISHSQTPSESQRTYQIFSCVYRKLIVLSYFLFSRIYMSFVKFLIAAKRDRVFSAILARKVGRVSLKVDELSAEFSRGTVNTKLSK